MCGRMQAIVSAVLAAGADVDSAMQSGGTALVWAGGEGHAPVVKLLLDAGAGTECALSDGRTALRMAAEAGHVAAVRMLVAAKANVNSVDSSGDTALMQAASSGAPASGSHRPSAQCVLERRRWGRDARACVSLRCATLRNVAWIV